MRKPGIEFWFSTSISGVLALILLTIETLIVLGFTTRLPTLSPKSIALDLVQIMGFAVVLLLLISVVLNWYHDCWKPYRRKDHIND